MKVFLLGVAFIVTVFAMALFAPSCDGREPITLGHVLMGGCR